MGPPDATVKGRCGMARNKAKLRTPDLTRRWSNFDSLKSGKHGRHAVFCHRDVPQIKTPDRQTAIRTTVLLRRRLLRAAPWMTPHPAET